MYATIFLSVTEPVYELTLKVHLLPLTVSLTWTGPPPDEPAEYVPAVGGMSTLLPVLRVTANLETAEADAVTVADPESPLQSSCGSAFSSAVTLSLMSSTAAVSVSMRARTPPQHRVQVAYAHRLVVRHCHETPYLIPYTPTIVPDWVVASTYLAVVPLTRAMLPFEPANPTISGAQMFVPGLPMPAE